MKMRRRRIYSTWFTAMYYIVRRNNIRMKNFHDAMDLARAWGFNIVRRGGDGYSFIVNTNKADRPNWGPNGPCGVIYHPMRYKNIVDQLDYVQWLVKMKVAGDEE